MAANEQGAKPRIIVNWECPACGRTEIGRLAGPEQDVWPCEVAGVVCPECGGCVYAIDPREA